MPTPWQTHENIQFDRQVNKHQRKGAHTIGCWWHLFHTGCQVSDGGKNCCRF